MIRCKKCSILIHEDEAWAHPDKPNMIRCRSCIDREIYQARMVMGEDSSIVRFYKEFIPYHSVKSINYLSSEEYMNKMREERAREERKRKLAKEKEREKKQIADHLTDF